MDELQHINTETLEVDIKKLEQCIVKIILKIKKNRNRPCHQNILTFVNRGGFDINMDRLKEVLNNLIENNLIRNNGQEGRESFCVIDEQIDEQIMILMMI